MPLDRASGGRRAESKPARDTAKRPSQESTRSARTGIPRPPARHRSAPRTTRPDGDEARLHARTTRSAPRRRHSDRIDGPETGGRSLSGEGEDLSESDGPSEPRRTAWRPAPSFRSPAGQGSDARLRARTVSLSWAVPMSGPWRPWRLERLDDDVLAVHRLFGRLEADRRGRPQELLALQAERPEQQRRRLEPEIALLEEQT
jgi:hypothetical protein